MTLSQHILYPNSRPSLHILNMPGAWQPTTTSLASPHVSASSFQMVTILSDPHSFRAISSIFSIANGFGETTWTRDLDLPPHYSESEWPDDAVVYASPYPITDDAPLLDQEQKEAAWRIL